MATLATSSNASSGAGKPSGKQGRMTAPDLAFWKDCLHDGGPTAPEELAAAVDW